MSFLLAQVAVEGAVYHFDKLFTYGVPQELAPSLQPGMRVTVPFGAGNRGRVAMVFQISWEEQRPQGTKDIASLLDAGPVLSQPMLDLALWMKDRCYCALFEAVKAMLPAGLQFRMRESLVLAQDFKDYDREQWSDTAWQVIDLLRRAGKSVPLEKLEKDLGLSKDHPELARLLKLGVARKVNTAASKGRDATSKMARPVLDFTGKLTPRQRDVYQTLVDVGEASEKELCYFTGASPSVLKALCQKGAVELFEYEVYRRPQWGEVPRENWEEKPLSPAQGEVFRSLWQEYKDRSSGGRCALLYGVTGSGKTLVFFQLIQAVVKEGKGVIVMVPEISLTAQTIRPFQQRFGDKVALFHSGLSLGERMDEWKRVRRGEAQIVIGTRSAVFAPVKDLGLIVLDEEQEHTYKSESTPRYDAREAARYRCGREDAFCLLSSATPSMESYRMAQEGKIHFHKLEQRFGPAQIPQVELVDRNLEDIPGSGRAIGPVLEQALVENFRQGRQSIVLLNRRGYHTFASCRSCHEVVTCPHCSISLTYHSANRRLMCHYCGYSIPWTDTCPTCGKEGLTFQGLGTQRAEEQLQELLPEAKILRVDTDAITEKFALERKLSEFARGDYQVMVGTQMVAKGLNFENVTLVGVVSADQSLFSDDYRSNERTFDLLTQVVGRAGRGKYPGRAVIQTFAPENRVLHLAAEQNYPEFYREEMLYRKAMLYPPFVDLLVMGFVGEQDALTRQAAEAFLQDLGELAGKEYPELPLRVLRPSPAAVLKVSNKYRYKLLIKCRNTPRLRELIARLLGEFARRREFQKVTVYADPNPDRVL